MVKDNICSECRQRLVCSHAADGRWKCPTGYGPVEGRAVTGIRGNTAFLEDMLARAVNLLSQIRDMTDAEFDEDGFIILDATTGPDDQGVDEFMTMVRKLYPEF